MITNKSKRVVGLQIKNNFVSKAALASTASGNKSSVPAAVGVCLILVRFQVLMSANMKMAVTTRHNNPEDSHLLSRCCTSTPYFNSCEEVHGQFWTNVSHSVPVLGKVVKMECVHAKVRYIGTFYAVLKI
jgi:hypothetical protein